MSVIRRSTQLIGATALAAAGVLLALEAAEVIGARWRVELADAFESVAAPSWSLWLTALVGAALLVTGVALLAAQLAPPKRGLRTMHEVYSGGDGDTSISGRAAISAARHELEQIEGVVGVDARVHRKTMTVEVRVDDRVNVADVEQQAREALGHEFWIDLGLADFGVNILITHHPNPPRAR